MDELDALDCEVDRKKEALASKQAVISLMDCEARIDDWSDRELMSRLALVLSFDEGNKVVEDRPDDGEVGSKLVVILFALIEVDEDKSAEVADEEMELFAMLDVVVVAAEAAVATLRVAWILSCLLGIVMPSRYALCKSFIHQMP